MSPAAGFLAVRPAGVDAIRLCTRHGWVVIDVADIYAAADLLVDAAETIDTIHEGTTL